jgi:hypothetical protein
MTNLKKNYYDCLWEKYLSQAIKTFPENFWDFDMLSRNPNITWDIVKANIDKPWCFFYLSQNSNITWEIVQNNPDKNWCFGWLSQNSNITWEIVQANPDKPWSYSMLSENPNITWQIVQDNPDENWCFGGLSENPNITWDIVKANLDLDWDDKIFLINHVGKQKFIEEQLKRAVNFVSDWFIELKTNPDSNLCKKWMKTVQSEFYNKNPWE